MLPQRLNLMELVDTAYNKVMSRMRNNTSDFLPDMIGMDSGGHKAHIIMTNDYSADYRNGIIELMSQYVHAKRSNVIHGCIQREPPSSSMVYEATESAYPYYEEKGGKVDPLNMVVRTISNVQPTDWAQPVFDYYIKEGLPYPHTGSAYWTEATKQPQKYNKLLMYLKTHNSQEQWLDPTLVNRYIPETIYRRWFALLGQANLDIIHDIETGVVGIDIISYGNENASTGWRVNGKMQHRRDLVNILIPNSDLFTQMKNHVITYLVLDCLYYMLGLPLMMIQPTSPYFDGLDITRGDGKIVNMVRKNSRVVIEMESGARQTSSNGTSVFENSSGYKKWYGPNDPMTIAAETFRREFNLKNSEPMNLETVYKSDIYPDRSVISNLLQNVHKEGIKANVSNVISFDYGFQDEDSGISLGADHSIHFGKFYYLPCSHVYMMEMLSGRINTASQYLIHAAFVVKYAYTMMQEYVKMRNVSASIKIGMINTGDDQHLILDREDWTNGLIDYFFSRKLFNHLARVKTCASKICKISGAIRKIEDDGTISFYNNPRSIKSAAARLLSTNYGPLIEWNQLAKSHRIQKYENCLSIPPGEATLGCAYQVSKRPNSYFTNCGIINFMSGHIYSFVDGDTYMTESSNYNQETLGWEPAVKL